MFSTYVEIVFARGFKKHSACAGILLAHPGERERERGEHARLISPDNNELLEHQLVV